MVTSLAECQQLFWRCVRFDPAPAALEDEMVGMQKLDARRSMGVYRDMHWHRQVDALFDVFPRLAEALGTPDFTRTACAYLAAHPSRWAELERLGTDFPAFLAQRAPRWVDLAQLELHAVLVLIAPPSRRTATISEIDPRSFEASRLELAPAHAVLRVARSAFDQVMGGRSATDAVVSVLVQRVDHRVTRRVLDADEADALRAAAAAAPAAEICAAFGEPSRAHAVLSTWFETGLVVDLLPARDFS